MNIQVVSGINKQMDAGIKIYLLIICLFLVIIVQILLVQKFAQLVQCTKNADGFVIVNEEICIGCRYCHMACPYDAPQYDAQKVI